MQKLQKRNIPGLLIPFIEIGAKAISFVVIILLTRIITIEEYGVYNFSIAIASWFLVIADTGIGWFIFNSAIKKDKSQLNLAINTRLIQSLIVLFVVPILFNGTTNSFLITFLITFFFLNTGFVRVLQTMFRGFGHNKNDIILAATEPLFRLFFIATIYSLNIKIDLLQVCFAFSLIGLVLTIIFLSVNFKKLGYHLTIPKFKDYIVLINQTKVYFLYQFFQVGIARIDVFFLEKYLGSKGVAIYASAYNLYTAFTLFFLAAITANIKFLFKRIQFRYFLLLLIGAILAALSYKYYFIDWFTIIYPKEYGQGSTLLFLFIFCLPFYIGYQLKLFHNNYVNDTRFTAMTFGIVFLIKLMCYLYFDLKNPFSAALYFCGFEVLTFILIFSLSKKNTNEGTSD